MAPFPIHTDSKSGEVDLPKIVTASDYHDFVFMEKMFRDKLGLDIRVSEIGFCDGEYHGLIHLGTFDHMKLLHDLQNSI